MENVIELEHVDAGYPGVVILKDVTFSVAKSEIFILLGGSGCGKTTIMRHLIGLNPILGGRLTVAGLEWGPQSVLECDLGDTKAIARHLRGRNRPDAIVCGFDAMALRVKSVADSIGLKVPDRLMIAGFDDAEFARYLSPSLTSIRQPINLIAEATTDALLNRIRNPKAPPKSVQLDVELICRASTFRRPGGCTST